MGELIKLFFILGGGILIIGIGFIVQKKHLAKKKAELEMMSNSYSSDNNQISKEELTAKQYIENYKSQFPRDSIKQALIQSGNSESNIENWLNKYI